MRGVLRGPLRVCRVTAVVVLSPSLAAWTPTRSVKAYCDTVETHNVRYLAAISHASSESALAGFLDSAAAIGDLKSMWDDLAKVAPSDIEIEIEIEIEIDTVRDAWDKAADHNWLGAAAVALESAAPMQRVNGYITKKCGVNAAPVLNDQPTTASPAPSPNASDASTAIVTVNPGSLSL